MAEETCVLDPVEFIPERVELALDQLGLEVRAEGVDWGESQITPEMVKQAEGETSSSGHRAGVQIRIPLRVKAEGEISLAEVAHKLQQKCGTIQDFGGWIRRDFDDEGGFAGSIGYKILRHTLAISGLQGWLFAHRQDAPDVVLTATRWPIGYRPDEREQGPFTSAPGDRHLIFDEVASDGSAAGLWRGRFTNEGSEDLRGLIFSRECHTAPDDLEDPTAQPHYLARDLTLKGGAEVSAGPNAPEVRATGTVASGTGAISPALPTGSETGDLLIMVAESGGATASAEANTPLTAAGWSSPPAPYSDQKKGNTRLTILYRIATGEDPRTTNDTGDHQLAKIIAIKAGTFDPHEPFNTAAVGTQAATKAVSIPGATTTLPNCLVVACATGNLPAAPGTAEFFGAANADLAGLSERIDNTTAAGDGGAIFAVTGAKAAKGVYASTTVTAVTSAERAVASIAINAPIYVEHKALTVGWITVLESEISGVGHMTHQGPRVLWLRIYDPGEEAGGVQLKVLCRALGASRWDESLPIVSTPVVDGWVPVRMGVAQPGTAVLGNQRWEFKVQLQAPGGSGVLRIRDVYPLSTEQYMVLSEPEQVLAADAQTTKPPGAGASKTRSKGTVDWSNPGNIVASDAAKASIKLGNTQSHYLQGTNYGFALPSTAVPVAVIGGIAKACPAGVKEVRDASVRLVIGGVPVGPDKANHSYEDWQETESFRFYEWTPTELKELGLTREQVVASDFGIAIAIERGKLSETEALVNYMPLTVSYVAEPPDDTSVCVATRSLELRTDVVIRQHPSDDVWGDVVPEGFRPFVPSGGLEGRQARTILIPSVGDLAAQADAVSGTPCSVTSHSRDGYHFAREASG